jgi:hypothetical protein
MIETLFAALMGILVVFGGLYVTLRWIVLGGQSPSRLARDPRGSSTSGVQGPPLPAADSGHPTKIASQFTSSYLDDTSAKKLGGNPLMRTSRNW